MAAKKVKRPEGGIPYINWTTASGTSGATALVEHTRDEQGNLVRTPMSPERILSEIQFHLKNKSTVTFGNTADTPVDPNKYKPLPKPAAAKKPAAKPAAKKAAPKAAPVRLTREEKNLKAMKDQQAKPITKRKAK